MVNCHTKRNGKEKLQREEEVAKTRNILYINKRYVLKENTCKTYLLCCLGFAAYNTSNKNYLFFFL